MHSSRRNFLKTSALGMAALPAAMLGGNSLSGLHAAEVVKLPPSILALQSVTSRIVPITNSERKARLAKAQQLMAENKIDAMYMDGGSSMEYFTGIRWFTSERLMGFVLPKVGDPIYITPAFEQSRAQEQIVFGHDVRVWQEHEDPYQRVAQVMSDLHASTGTLGIEEQVPYFRTSRIAEALPHARLVSAIPITGGCRSIKSPAELALMQVANDATLAAYHAIYLGLEPGITQDTVRDWLAAAYERLGVSGGASINVGKYTALPHGSVVPQRLVEGTPLLIDGDAVVEGYHSDISRTFVLGKPSDKMKKVFDIVHKAQAAALKAAHPGATMESIDAAARKVIVDSGYGPDYKYFGHRLGHGIGMNGHEWYYLVRGNKRKMERNMTFSDEPGIYIPGEFGVRLEDDMYITENGAQLFTPQSPSLERPFS
ncbi:aminopeptidase P family protein [Rhodanobacter sp. T12-5]|nr:aminopeptidase P family protein [Rhodanobacter sp. T12-5]